MRFRVINIVDNLSRLNFGIWNAAINTAGVLAQNHDIASELWYPAASREEGTELPTAITVRELATTKIAELEKLVDELNPERDIIVTHGSWRYPTRWGAWLRAKGFRWVYVPHGMLEPWSVQQKALKKRLYWTWVEGPKTRRAAGIRAVGKPERANLLKRYGSVIFIPNGHSARANNFVRNQYPLQFLYLARLHSKKRPVQLVEAWLASSLAGKADYRLVIAGPDEGEQAAITALLASPKASNITLSEPVYGQDKERLLRQSHFFLLPSLSEGFPTSVVEALSESLIPLISQGCNFPEVFEQGLSLDCGTEPASIQRALEEAADLSPSRRAELQNRCRAFAVANYSLDVVARHQAFWYGALLGLHNVPRNARQEALAATGNDRPSADEDENIEL